MFKQLLTACVVSTMGLCSMAAESQVVFTYAGDEAGYWGKGKSEIYDVAIRISDPALAGKKIVGIRALINATEGVENTSLWLSKELKLEKNENNVKVNVPDTYSENVAISAVNDPGFDCGEMSVTLSDPYVLTEEGIYVGYTLEVPKADELTDMQQYPLLFSPCNNPESLYIRASKDFLKWMPYNDRVGAAAMIYVTLEGEFPEYSVGLKNLAYTYASQNEDFTVKAELSNIGSHTAESLDYTYTVDGESHDAHFVLEQPIAPNLVSSSFVDLPVEALSELGDHALELTITKVNGQENVSAATTAATNVTVLPYVPVHRPLVEEFTGTWCGWCTRGYMAMELLNEEFGDGVVLAAYHNGDPMQVTSAYPVSVSGFPSATLNRNGVIDPYYGTNDAEFGMRYDVIDCINTVVPADIQVEADWADADKTLINVTTKARFFENNDNAGYKVGYLLINNGLSGEGSSWNQSNYYYQYAGQLDGTPLEELTYWGSSVSGLIFNDVVVDVTDMKGVEGSIPSAIAYNEEYATDYSFDIASNNVIQDKEKLYVAAFIIAPNGTIINANKAHVGGDVVAVDAINSDASEVSAEYYNIAGSRVVAPQNGIFVKVAKMSDGTVRTSKVVVR